MAPVKPLERLPGFGNGRNCGCCGIFCHSGTQERGVYGNAATVIGPQFHLHFSDMSTLGTLAGEDWCFGGATLVRHEADVRTW